MKNLKSIIWLFVIVVSVIAQLVGDSSDLDKSTVCKNITVHYTDEVPDALAEGIAASIVEADLSDGRTIGVELRPGQGNYLLTIGVVGGQLTDDTRGTFEFFGRIITDRHSPSRPIAIEAVNGSRDKPLAVLHPAPPMGALCFHEGDYLFHSENITKSQAVEFAKALKTTGYFSGDLSLARIDRTDECYVLYACFAGDSETYKTQEFKDQKQANAFIFQSEVFAGASTKVLACELDLRPIDGLEWMADGLLPGQSVTGVDNIRVVHDESVTPEVATAIATRIPLRDESNESIISLELSGNGNEYDCRLVGDSEYADELNVVLSFWGREIFSELPNAKSLKVEIVEEDSEIPFLEREITTGHGRYMLIHGNRLFYPDQTPQSVLDSLQKGMESLGMCAEDTSFLIRLTHEAETYTVQIVLEEEPEDELAKPYLQEVGEKLAEAAFPNDRLRLELTDHNFDLFSDYAWQTDAQVSSVQTPAVAR